MSVNYSEGELHTHTVVKAGQEMTVHCCGLTLPINWFVGWVPRGGEPELEISRQGNQQAMLSGSTRMGAGGGSRTGQGGR